MILDLDAISPWELTIKIKGQTIAIAELKIADLKVLADAMPDNKLPDNAPVDTSATNAKLKKAIKALVPGAVVDKLTFFDMIHVAITIKIYMENWLKKKAQATNAAITADLMSGKSL